MILCHKCAGTFQEVDGLNACRCISGYPRGFEPDVTPVEAAKKQVIAELDWLKLFVQQGRGVNDQNVTATFDRLKRSWKTLNKLER